MYKFRLDQWCRTAVSGIRYVPDRHPVYQELFDHCEALYDHYTAQGLSHPEAEAAVIKDMGSAEDLIKPLAAVHKPFSGYLLTWTGRIFRFLLITAVLLCGLFICEKIYLFPAFQAFHPEDHFPYAGETEVLFFLTPGTRDSSDGYTFTLDKAILYRQTLGGEDNLLLNLQVRSFHPLPWAEKAGYSGWFWATDSLGNYYYAHNQDSVENSPSIQVTDYHTGLFSYTHDFWINAYISREAQWLELHYDRAGRDVTLRLDLTGGDVP